MLKLRDLKIEDADRVFELASNWNVAKTTLNIPHPYPLNGATIWIEEVLSDIKSQSKIVQAVEFRGELIGVIGLLNVQRAEGEIGYWVGEQFWGKGFASQMSSKFVSFLKSHSNINSIIGHCFQSNIASRKVLESIGLNQIGEEPTINREGNTDTILKFQGKI